MNHETSEIAELETLVENIESLKQEYQNTENWSTENSDAPINLEYARYVLGSKERVFQTWNRAHEVYRKVSKKHWKNLGEMPELMRDYRQFRSDLEENTKFLEELYDLEQDKSLQRQRIESDYNF